jgi:hypothetical protein
MVWSELCPCSRGGGPVQGKRIRVILTFYSDFFRMLDLRSISEHNDRTAEIGWSLTFCENSGQKIGCAMNKNTNSFPSCSCCHYLPFASRFDARISRMVTVSGIMASPQSTRVWCVQTFRALRSWTHSICWHSPSLHRSLAGWRWSPEEISCLVDYTSNGPVFHVVLVKRNPIDDRYGQLAANSVYIRIRRSAFSNQL